MSTLAMLSMLLPAASALSIGLSAPVRTRTQLGMFFQSEKNGNGLKADPNDFALPAPAKARPVNRNGKTVVVTDGTGSFYTSRAVFQMLHDFGRYSSIIASSPSVPDAKKMLSSRNARYSGLVDVLSYSDAAFGDAAAGADMWLCVNADEASLVEQISAAAAAGVRRAFVLLSASGPTTALVDAEAVTSALEASGMAYTIMRTGSLALDRASEGGLKLDEVDVPVCEDVPREELFRFVTEALTLPAAEGRSFSLCPTEATTGQLKEMRFAGYERRDEVDALLQGFVAETPDGGFAAVAASEEGPELVMRSEAELAAEREEELKALLESARQKGLQKAKQLEFEEAEKEEWRKDMRKYYSNDKGPEGADDDATRDSEPKA